MKVALLAGGFGTRLSEETSIRPKPMVEIGGMPIMWHIMKMYAHYGLKDFVVLGGYKVDFIRDYFYNFRARQNNFTIDLSSGKTEWLEAAGEDWRVTILDTGAESMTGGRIRRARKYLEDDTFCLTYGDGLSDVNIDKLREAHKQGGGWCTMTAVTQPGRYGALKLDPSMTKVEGFREKGAADGGLINGGFFVCEPDVFSVIDDDLTTWEQQPMDRMVEMDKLRAYHHDGYWQSMDSLRDKQVLESQWSKGAPWKLWSN
ncbi:glucose-1-phosphate cytidylyltransferase [Devosia faecipullorum]|uniref:glucose-1-phosphate cytidylyltransferase n=1 Tax=Devosia faecipullorum TaxID=2755039 RepID=UPI00187B40E3|nr:glucose-1-phosphate cytidylyltransferase [Devosia faecipullorum]MBE7731952.1 glucose-1-phosphate cytidylyltransferase [Devosia faecipullorum]